MFTLSHLLDRLTWGNHRRPRPADRAIRPAALESLEGRRMFAVAPAPLPFVDGAGVLQVAGTRQSDVIVVALDAADATKLSVTVNGVVTPVDLATVTGGVNVTGGNGHDDIRVDAAGGEVTLAVTVSGGNGKDVLVGGAGPDTLDGGNGNDTITANAGDDTLRGGNGKDVLDAGDGNDNVDGGRGKDRLVGGLGVDHFVGKRQETEAEDETLEDLFDAAAGPKKGGR